MYTITWKNLTLQTYYDEMWKINAFINALIDFLLMCMK